MNVSQSAKDLLQAFEYWLEDSSKKIYRFELEEQMKLQNMITVMNNQLNMLIDYEIKRQQEKNK